MKFESLFNMTNQQESRLIMYLTVKEYQASYTAITNALPNYQANSTIFLNTILQIHTIAEQQRMSKKGITEDKNRLKESLIVMVGDYAHLVYDLAQPIVASLAAYLITDATQTSLLNAINGYNDALATPRVGTVVRSQATKQLVVLFKTVDAALANMDAAVEIVRLTQVNFYNGYKTARKIYETGIGTIAVKGLVTDTESVSDGEMTELTVQLEKI